MNLLLPLLIVAAAGAFAFAKTGTNLQDNINIKFYNLGKLKFEGGFFKAYFDLQVMNYSKEIMSLSEYNLKIYYFKNPSDYGKDGKGIEVGRCYATNQKFQIKSGNNVLNNFSSNIDVSTGLSYFTQALNTGLQDMQVTGYVTINNLKFPVNERISFAK